MRHECPIPAQIARRSSSRTETRAHDLLHAAQWTPHEDFPSAAEKSTGFQKVTEFLARPNLHPCHQIIGSSRVHGEHAVQLHEKNRMSGFLRFKHTDSLFPALAGRFDYVVSLATQDGDRLAGPVYAPFAWNSYGSFLEWFHAPEGYEVSGWNHVHVFAVFDPPELFHFDFNAACLLERPSFDPSRHFVPAPGVEAASLEIRMEQDESSGCVDLVLRHADGETTIGISEVFQPVGPLLEWLRGVDSDDLPLCLTIEDEGPTWRLEAYPAGAPDLMLLRVHDPYDDTGVPLECLLDQMRFVEELRTAMRDFFASGFQPDRWSDGDDAGRLLKKRMLSDPWLMRDYSGALPRQ